MDQIMSVITFCLKWGVIIAVGLFTLMGIISLLCWILDKIDTIISSLNSKKYYRELDRIYQQEKLLNTRWVKERSKDKKRTKYMTKIALKYRRLYRIDHPVQSILDIGHIFKPRKQG